MSKELSILHISRAAREWGFSERQFRLILEDREIPIQEWESTSGRARLFVKRVDLVDIPKKVKATGKDWMRRRGKA